MVAMIPLTGIAFLVLTAAISLIWSSFKLLGVDEWRALLTDSRASIIQLFEIQRTCPISLDPMVNHLMANVAMRIFGASAFALRLPSLLGFLTMQVCLFFFLRQIATQRAALFAMAFPALTPALYYSVEGRPYGLLLGLCALMMLSWQTATRRQTNRTVALITLALALALLLNTQYFRVLLFAPIAIAELLRTLQRKRLDLPLLAAVGAGAGGIVFALPFMRVASEFSDNYNDGVQVRPQLIIVAFREVLAPVHAHFFHNQLFFFAVFALAAFAVLWVCVRQVRSAAVLLPVAEAGFLIALAALPFFGYLMALSVTHALPSRYVICAVVGFSALLAIGLDPLFRRDRAGNLCLILLFVVVALGGVIHVRQARMNRQETLSSLDISPGVKAVLKASPSERLLFQNTVGFALASYYEPDAELRSRMVLVYSRDREMLWTHRDLEYISALHMRGITGLPTEDFELVESQPGDHIFVVYTDPAGGWVNHGWNWLDQAFVAAHAKVSLIGPAFQGEVESVRFRP